VQYRRVLPPEVFFTNWSYVDHVLMPPGSSIGAHKHMGVEEICYVMDGEGTVRVNDETAPVKKDDAMVMAPGDVQSFEKYRQRADGVVGDRRGFGEVQLDTVDVK